MTGHAKGVGITDEDLEKVKQKAMQLPYVEVRGSTGGGGLHLYVYFETRHPLREPHGPCRPGPLRSWA